MMTDDIVNHFQDRDLRIHTQRKRIHWLAETTSGINLSLQASRTELLPYQEAGNVMTTRSERLDKYLIATFAACNHKAAT